MHFPNTLIHGKLIRRYKRFLADIQLDSGEVVIAHCTNSGSMKSCIEEGAEVYVSSVNDVKRKTQFTWEMIKINGRWVGVNTGMPNVIAYQYVKDHKIEKLAGYDIVKREVTFGDSRFDLYCENNKEKCFIEVKNVTLKVGHSALFPDAITTRGQKHLKTLMEVKKSGYRAVMLYIIQRTDVNSFGPAQDIDPDYADLLKQAKKFGVEVLAIQARVTPQFIELLNELPLLI